LNEYTEEQYENIGKFDYEKHGIPNDSKYPVLGPYQLKSGSVYLGQWKNGQKHGRGKLAWEDGSLYEGQWVNNMSNGKGRLIHSDGDVYEGDWVDNKAEGQG